MRFVTPMTYTKASTPAEMTVAQSLDEIKLRIARLEQAVVDHIRITTAALYQAKELWKPCWIPVEADGDLFDGYEWTDIKAWAEMPKPFEERN